METNKLEDFTFGFLGHKPTSIVKLLDDFFMKKKKKKNIYKWPKSQCHTCHTSSPTWANLTNGPLRLSRISYIHVGRVNSCSISCVVNWLNIIIIIQIPRSYFSAELLANFVFQIYELSSFDDKGKEKRENTTWLVRKFSYEERNENIKLNIRWN